jgi:outer membrane protein assembly factor BamD
MNKWQLIITICVFLSCAGNKTVNVSTAQEEFHRAKELLENKKYDKAIETFKDVIYKYPGSRLMEDAQYWLARAYFDKKDYEQAELEYRFLLRNFPNSRFVIRAEYELALTYLRQSPHYYLDQTVTKKALKALEKFIAKYGDTELAREAEKARIECIDKLARKELETAKLYKKMGKPDAVLFYLDGIEEKYPETTFLPEIEKLRRELF